MTERGGPGACAHGPPREARPASGNGACTARNPTPRPAAWGAARSLGRIAADDLGRRGPRRYPIVELAGGVCHPPCAVGAELDAAHPRHVPQEPVAAVGKGERYANLGVPLDEVDTVALLVQQAVLVLAEPVDALPAGRR